MCAVSMVTQHYFDQFPNPRQFPVDRYQDYAELVRKAAEYDRIMKQPDCPDPKKQEWHAELEKFMREKYGIEPKSL